MIYLTKPVKRITRAQYRGLNIVVELEPPDIICLRLKGCHTRYRLSVLGAFYSAMKVEALAWAKQKREERELKRNLKRGYL